MANDSKNETIKIEALSVENHAILLDMVALQAELLEQQWQIQSLEKMLAQKPYQGWYICNDSGGMSAEYGFILAQIIKPEAEIITILVPREKQGQGWGQRLLNHLIDECYRVGVGRIVLDVAATNITAQTFYLKNGFTPISTRKNYYRFIGKNGKNMVYVDALVMQKEI